MYRFGKRIPQHHFLFSSFQRRLTQRSVLLRKNIETMTDAEFQEQTNHLRNFVAKGARSSGILVLGFAAVYFADRQIRKHTPPLTSPEKEMVIEELSPTERYLHEMIDGGWPVDEDDVKFVAKKDKKAIE